MDNNSGYKGVTRTPNGRFVVHCKGKNYGTYDTDKDAHKAYCKTATELFGDFARFE
ncbi:MAG: hypothetical protein IID03_12765 [Candidatus Dadabacteria bacterium]|nr:hypothetical protein [Candidatus Dadabacteria bacterium]